MKDKLTMLMILDGFGINEQEEGNSIKLAKIPNISEVLKKNPNTIIHTSGIDVGLPEGQMGNSEVGHTNIGAGRIIYQDLAKITKSIEDGDFFSKAEFVSAIENCKKNGSNLHIMGLLSDGGVHSHIEHVYGLLELAKKNETALEQISDCKSLEELTELFDELCSKYFLHYNVRVKEFRKEIESERFKQLNLKQQKEMFSRMLDLNQLYVNTDDRHDKNTGLTEDDIAITEDFYQLK